MDSLFYHLKIMMIEQETQDVFFRKRKIKYYNVMIDEQNIFDQPVKNDLGHMVTFEKLQLVIEVVTQPVVY